ncbi:hypothetical protein BDK51DRAFT_26392 [Blyttiomyces helicus]|uniref:Uncharacterized protein n=1 Tax=Blyttiomyces helicus TaxID=388810 RepID=A0A4P9W2Q2_9FUNG|nr:hypothetical protein BDK51DRAFT_26392 [Blyttiomyces helicus]|eukprot:RKO86539.1 hypothetical protein BDK51DRAFT_26392 [Blyttiomyces helicus]
MDEPKYFIAYLGKAIRKSRDATGDSVDVNGPSAAHHLDFIQTDTTMKPLGDKNISDKVVGNPDNGDVVYCADKESEVEQEGRENQAPASGDEDGICEQEEDGNADDDATKIAA